MNKPEYKSLVYTRYYQPLFSALGSSLVLKDMKARYMVFRVNTPMLLAMAIMVVMNNAIHNGVSFDTMTITKTAEDSPTADGVFEVSITTMKFLNYNKMDLRFVGWTPP